MKSILETLEAKNELWLKFLSELSAERAINEQASYDNYSFDGKHFYEWIEKGREVLDNVYELEPDDHEAQNTSNGNDAGRNREPVEERQLNVQLPRLQLPEFSGDPHKWISFWQCFESSVDKQNFSKVDKMNFLLSCLKGEAKDAISDLMLSNENYKIAVEILKRKYGDKNIIVEGLNAELFSLAPAFDNPLSLKRTVDKIEKIFRQLESIGEETDSSVWTSLIKSKLHKNLLFELVREEQKSKKKWNTKELREALSEMVNLRESVYQSTRHFRNKIENTNEKQIRNNHDQDDANESFYHLKNEMEEKLEQARSFQNSCNEQPNISCYFCGKNHWSSDCKIVWRREDRMKRLMEQRRCFKCLRKGHRVKDCLSRKNCYACNGPHNVAICSENESEYLRKLEKENDYNDENYDLMKKSCQSQIEKTEKSARKFWKNGKSSVQNNDEQNDGDEIVENERNVQARTYCTLRNTVKPKLMMLRAKVFAPGRPNKTVETFIFLDSGSEVSYIEESLAKKLKLPKMGSTNLEVYAFQGMNQGTIRTTKYNLGIERNDRRRLNVELYSIKKISESMHSLCLKKIVADNDMEVMKKNIVIEKGRPEILLGIKDFWRFFVKMKEISKDCFIVETTIGTVICGNNQKNLFEEPIMVQNYMSILPSKIYEMENEEDINSYCERFNCHKEMKSVANEGNLKMRKFLSKEKNSLIRIPVKNKLKNELKPKDLKLNCDLNSDLKLSKINKRKSVRNVKEILISTDKLGNDAPILIFSSSVGKAKSWNGKFCLKHTELEPVVKEWFDKTMKVQYCRGNESQSSARNKLIEKSSMKFEEIQTVRINQKFISKNIIGKEKQKELFVNCLIENQNRSENVLKFKDISDVVSKEDSTIEKPNFQKHWKSPCWKIEKPNSCFFEMKVSIEPKFEIVSAKIKKEDSEEKIEEMNKNNVLVFVVDENKELKCLNLNWFIQLERQMYLPEYSNYNLFNWKMRKKIVVHDRS